MFIIGNILCNRASAKERKEKREQIKSHQQPASRLEIDQKLEERKEKLKRSELKKSQKEEERESHAATLDQCYSWESPRALQNSRPLRKKENKEQRSKVIFSWFRPISVGALRNKSLA